MERMKAVTPAAGAAIASLIALTGLTGCAAGAGASATPTVTVTSTVTAAPVAASPDDPLDALTAWTACAVLAQQVYGSMEPTEKMLPYDPSRPPTKSADGVWQVYVAYPIEPPVQGAGSVIVICHVSGTLGEPKLV